MRAIWNMLSGHKRTVGTVAGVALAWAQSKGLIDGGTATWLAGGLTAWGSVAVGHAIVKARAEP